MSIAFTPTFFCFPRYIYLSHASFRFILPLTFFCVSRSLPFVVYLLQTKGCEWIPCLPIVLLMFFIAFPCPALDLHSACHCSFRCRGRCGQDFWGNVVLLGRKEWVYPQYSPGKWFFRLAGVPSCNGHARKRQKHRKGAAYTLAWRTKLLPVREFRKDFFDV